MIVLERAVISELDECYAIVDSGRRFQREQGFVQWTDDYPDFDTVKDDIMTGRGYVLKDGGELAGYMFITLDGEPAYKDIDGAWHSDGPYAAVHRIAFSPKFRGRGLAGEAWSLISGYCRALGAASIRIDTDFPNTRMQHVLEKNGFRRCGIIMFQGSGKIAYDKLL